jgi:hypothetical protein
MDDCRAIAVLFDELAVCLGLARRVEFARRLAVGAAAPLVRLLAADGTSDSQGRMMMCGEVGHGRVLPVSWGWRATAARGPLPRILSQRRGALAKATPEGASGRRPGPGPRKRCGLCRSWPRVCAQVLGASNDKSESILGHGSVSLMDHADHLGVPAVRQAAEPHDDPKAERDRLLPERVDHVREP